MKRSDEEAEPEALPTSAWFIYDVGQHAVTRDDQMTVWHRVVWAPHTFKAALLFLVADTAFLLVIYTRDTGRDRVSDDKAGVIALGLAFVIALAHWVPAAA